MEDEIRVPCPCCKYILTVDDAGDLVKADDQPEEREGEVGLGGLRVVDADPGWKERNYHQQCARKAEKGPVLVSGFEHNLGPTPLTPSSRQQQLRTCVRKTSRQRL